MQASGFGPGPRALTLQPEGDGSPVRVIKSELLSPTRVLRHKRWRLGFLLLRTPQVSTRRVGKLFHRTWLFKSHFCCWSNWIVFCLVCFSVSLVQQSEKKVLPLHACATELWGGQGLCREGLVTGEGGRLASAGSAYRGYFWWHFLWVLHRPQDSQGSLRLQREHSLSWQASSENIDSFVAGRQPA